MNHTADFAQARQWRQTAPQGRNRAVQRHAFSRPFAEPSFQAGNLSERSDSASEVEKLLNSNQRRVGQRNVAGTADGWAVAPQIRPQHRSSSSKYSYKYHTNIFSVKVSVLQIFRAHSQLEERPQDSGLLDLYVNTHTDTSNGWSSPISQAQSFAR